MSFLIVWKDLLVMVLENLCKLQRTLQDRQAHGTLIAIQQSLIRESTFPTVFHYKVESIIYARLNKIIIK